MHNTANLATGVAAFTITPHDTVDFTIRPRGIYVGGPGNLVVVNNDGTTCLLSNVPGGALLPIGCKRINSTGTTASGIVGLS